MVRRRLWQFATLGLLCASGLVGAPGAGSESPTFYKNVLPILQQHCQSCHRPGEPGPMPLLTYEGTKPWASAIAQMVKSRQMPPWFADPAIGHFSNDRSLTAKDIRTIAEWVDGGAAAGDPKDAP